MRYEVTTIGGVPVESGDARPIGALALDVTKLTTPEVIAGAAAGLVLGLVVGALLARRR